MTFIVSPYRYTSRPADMRAFFELFGLRVSHRQGDFTVLQAAGGRVVIHPLATSEVTTDHATSLVFAVPDVQRSADVLEASGVSVTWWDESFGRLASMASPVGSVSFDEENDDPYGYDETATARPGRVDIVATVYAEDLDAMQSHFQHLGFAAGADSTSNWRPLRAASDSGLIGLLGGQGELNRLPDGSAATEIGLEVGEPLDELAARLVAAGIQVETVQADGPPHLVVIDPDGIPIEVYRANRF